MAVTELDYTEQAWALMPPGPAWDPELSPWLPGLLSGWAVTLLRVDAVISGLIDEADPRTTSALLPDWERVAGLPDSCVLAFGGNLTQAQRRAALLGRLVAKGGMSVSYYMQVAAALGYAITVTEFREPTVDDDVELALVGESWEAAWQVNAASTTSGELVVEDDVETPLAFSGNALLECVLARLNRAGATLVFNYS